MPAAAVSCRALPCPARNRDASGRQAHLALGGGALCGLERAPLGGGRLLGVLWAHEEGGFHIVLLI